MLRPLRHSERLSIRSLEFRCGLRDSVLLLALMVSFANILKDVVLFAFQ
jgi:hypothetical protein